MNGEFAAQTFAPEFNEQQVKLTFTMTAAVYANYGAPEVLQIKEVATPTPKSNEVLIKIHATGVSSGDARLRRADPFAVRFFFGLFKPSKGVLGFVLAGEVVAAGEAVEKFKVGDEVFGTTGMSFGAYAEYKALPETAVLALKPKHASYEEAAAIPFGGNTALHFIKKANILPGQKVLIYGASGAVGTAAVQLAKHFGAEVTGVCSTSNVELVKSIGADKVIDYTQSDFAQSGETYDVVFDTVGKAPMSSLLRVLDENGTLLQGAASPAQTLQGVWTAMRSNRKVHSGMIAETAENMTFLAQLMEDGRLKAVIDRTYPLAQIAEAHRYVDGGHKKGNVVITL